MTLLPTRREVWAKAPASVANLGPGFDYAAISFPHFWDSVGIAFQSEANTVILSGKSRLDGTPADAEKNIAVYAAKLTLERIQKISGQSFFGGLEIILKKNVPVGSGLGSSAASAVASVRAVSRMFSGDFSLSTEEMLEIAGRAEVLVSGAPHYDNAAASLCGGLIVNCRLPSEDPSVRALKLPNLPEWSIAAVVPKKRGVNTKQAREVLPQTVDFLSAVKQAGAAAGLIAAFVSADMRALSKVCAQDELVAPYRLKLYDEGKYSEALAAARKAADSGGWNVAVGLAGAGPSLFVIGETGGRVFRAASAMKNVLGDADVYLAQLSAERAEVYCQV